MPARTGLAVPKGLDQGGWMHAIVQASQFDATLHSSAFADLFGDAITDDTRALLADYAAN